MKGKIGENKKGREIVDTKGDTVKKFGVEENNERRGKG